MSGLERHLSSLKGLFLMGHGALFHSFFDKAREAMRIPAGDRCELDFDISSVCIFVGRVIASSLESWLGLVTLRTQTQAAALLAGKLIAQAATR